MPKGVFIRKPRSSEYINNMRLAQLGKKYPIDKYPNHGMRGKHHSAECKKIMHIKMKGRTITWGNKISKSNSGINNPMYGKITSNEVKQKISDNLKGKPFTEKHKNNLRKKWNDPVWKEKQIKLILKGLLKRPTSFELKILKLCFKHNLSFVYTGNGSFLINFKNPDFVNEKDKIVIEVFYSWFKIRDYDSVENYKEFCRKKYNSAGWKVIFIDENDINDYNWEQRCLNLIYKNTI